MKAKLTVNHDWLRVVTTDTTGRKLSLTVSRSGEKCSGSVDITTIKRAITAFGQLMKKEGTVKEKMDRLKAHAEAAADLDSYIAGIATV